MHLLKPPLYQRGFALMEVMVSISILTICIFGMLGSTASAMKQQRLASHRAQTARALQQVAEPLLFQSGNLNNIQTALGTGWPKTVVEGRKTYSINLVAIRNYENVLIENGSHQPDPAVISPTDSPITVTLSAVVPNETNLTVGTVYSTYSLKW